MTACVGDVVVREKRILTIRKRLRERKRSHVLRVVRRNSCQSCRPIFYFVPVETPAAFMSHAENQVRSSGLRMEPAVFRIKTIYRNYQRARFIEFDRTAFSSSPVPLFFFRRWQRALRLSLNPRAKNSRFVPAWRLIHTLSNLVDSRFFLSFVFFYFLIFFRSSK